MSRLIKVSDYIVNFYIKNNINKCFVVTGGGAMHLNDSLGHSEQIECIYNHHEQACSIAAEGYTRISGTPALVCVTSGPGSTNAVTGVLGAWLDSIPMIVLSGQMSLNTTLASTPLPLRQLGFQEFNIIDSVTCMTKYAVMITDPKYIAYHLEKSLYLAKNGRKGPVWLDIPLDIQSTMINEEELIHYDFLSDQYNIVEEQFNPKILDHILNKINNAKKPVILAGYGVRMSDSYNEFLETVSHLKIPVVTEWNSNDLI
jgi:acetolactate synthase-1/2/3 large subunit